MEVSCLLFSDMLLITKASSVRTKVSSVSCSGSASSLSPNSPTLSAIQHTHQCTLRIIKQPIRLDKLVIVELKDSCCAIFVILSDFGCTASNAYFMSADNMSVWIKRIRHAQDEYAKDTKRQQGPSSGSDSAGSCTGRLVMHRSRRRAGSPLSRVRQPASSSPPTSPSTATPSPTTPVPPSTSDVPSCPVTAVLCSVSGYLAVENTRVDERFAANNGVRLHELTPNDLRSTAAALLDPLGQLSARRRSSTVNRPLIDRVPEIHILAETPTQNSPLETNRAHCKFVYALRTEGESESEVESAKQRNGKQKENAECKTEKNDCQTTASCTTDGATKRLGRFASLRSRLLRKSQKHLVKATHAARTKHASMRKKLSDVDPPNCILLANPRTPRRRSWQLATQSSDAPTTAQSTEVTPGCSSPPLANDALNSQCKLGQPVLHRKHVYVTNAVTSSESTRTVQSPSCRSALVQKSAKDAELYKVLPAENLRARLHNWTAAHLHSVFSPGQRKARRTASVNQASVSTNSSQEAADLALARCRTCKSGPGTPLRPRSHSSCKGRVSGNAQCPGYMFTVGI